MNGGEPPGTHSWHENLEQKIRDELQARNCRRRRKSDYLMNTLAIISLGFFATYSMIKKKLLGSPPSKIRKGLLYATLAAFILYKCEGDRIEKIYVATKETVKKEYSDIKERAAEKNYLKAQLDRKTAIIGVQKSIISSQQSDLSKKQYALSQKQSELDGKQGFLDRKQAELAKRQEELDREQDLLRRQQGSFANIYNRLENKMEAYEADQKNMENILSGRESMLKKKDEELVQLRNENEYLKNEGKNRAKNQEKNQGILEVEAGIPSGSVNTSPSPVPNPVPAQGTKQPAPGNISLSLEEKVAWVRVGRDESDRSIVDKYYAGQVSISEIDSYNGLCSGSMRRSIPVGYPVRLVEGALRTTEGIIEGEYPNFIILKTSQMIENHLWDMFGARGEQARRMLAELKKYNASLGNELNRTVTDAMVSGAENYCVYIPKSWPMTEYTINPEKIRRMNCAGRR